MSVGEKKFLHQEYTSASAALSCQMPFCKIAARLLSVIKPPSSQKTIGYWQEGSTSTSKLPAFITDIVGRYNKTGVITFGVTLIPSVTFVQFPHFIYSHHLYIYFTYFHPPPLHVICPSVEAGFFK